MQKVRTVREKVFMLNLLNCTLEKIDVVELSWSVKNRLPLDFFVCANNKRCMFPPEIAEARWGWGPGRGDKKVGQARPRGIVAVVQAKDNITPRSFVQKQKYRHAAYVFWNELLISQGEKTSNKSQLIVLQSWLPPALPPSFSNSSRGLCSCIICTYLCQYLVHRPKQRRRPWWTLSSSLNSSSRFVSYPRSYRCHSSLPPAYTSLLIILIFSILLGRQRRQAKVLLVQEFGVEISRFLLLLHLSFIFLRATSWTVL